MPEVISDIVVSAARLFHSPIGTALPLDTLDVDAAWPVGWVSVGYTLEPVKAQYTFDVLEVMVQQEMGTVKRIRIKEALKLGTILAELTATNMALAFAGETTRMLAFLPSATTAERSLAVSYGILSMIDGATVCADEFARMV